MKIYKKDNYRVPVKAWLDDIEDKAQEQIDNVATLPFLYHHLAVMSDCHMGYGVPIGSVVATQHVISPNMVGVDIGCGMCATKTNLKEISTEDLKKVLGIIRGFVPVGFSHHKEPYDKSFMPKTVNLKEECPIAHSEYERAEYQLGTLGGGNHFIEIQRGDDGYIWYMIHSGSRNFGYQIAKHYNNLAKELNERWYTSVPLKYDLAFLPLDAVEGQMYMKEMNYALLFARENRDRMAASVEIAFGHAGIEVEFDDPINIHHNYAAIENHFGKNVVIHRKGATSAREGQLGIIPGSQGTCSYIVKGKGNPESFMSCSHGAGRRMGRKQAKKNLNLEEEIKHLDDQGIIHGIRSVDDLDEAPSAYKSIDEVMENQKDLVDIITKLTPLAVIKG